MAQLLFKTTFTTRIHDIDAAGVVFFARIFYYLHDAYEDFLNSHGLSISTILNTDFILPITHSEADFKAPIFLNEQITIEILTRDISTDGFSLTYHFIDASGKIKATALSKHVCLDTRSRGRKKLPDTILSLLK